MNILFSNREMQVHEYILIYYASFLPYECIPKILDEILNKTKIAFSSLLLFGISHFIISRIKKTKPFPISNQDNYDNINILPESQSVQISQTLDDRNSKLNMTKQLNINQPDLQIITKFPIEPLDEDSKNCLKKLTYNDRPVDPIYKFYIRDQLTQAEFFNYYTIQSIYVKKELKKYCISMIPARGDGNCFYTSFGYQFLKFLINDQNLYQEIKQKYSNIEFKIEKNQEWLINDQKKLLNRFFKILDILVNQQENLRNEFLFKLIAAHEEDKYNCDGFFNPLTVIFLRNLAFKLVMESDELRDVVFDKENLLIWEKECNNNEPIIKLLAENLKVHVNLLFFDNRNFKLMEYGKESDKLIILLMKPGHYNIGIAP